ncbi:NAD(P)-binding domain-containing protein [Limibaculum sp. M0105]|uniref:NAD(P)-binding domain-containing protein n=1 Tax=Thermohalobaculum xanthum TaxID=2753746 RepID=A0A8J7M642_9RHOB|nr:NAD(P)-binding domain-containing protein [Thermohalobaculum xanthum]MBK0398542.1 NAD(P)-binding domain-containing protein [Thermohalobaculum xanthum]
MRCLSTIIIGAGQCGLAMSAELTARSVEHVVLERGEVANTWRTERWDSLRLLTPNWMSRLPGQAYDGPDPDGYMSMPEIIGRLSAYAGRIEAPVMTGVSVRRVSPGGAGWRIETTAGNFMCRSLVMATGACNIATVPGCAAGVPPGISMATPVDYRRPSDLPEGGVLVVGGSATGVQLAREIRLSGRPVVLSVGEHVRVPRRYRGRDIKWWMEAVGLLDQRYDEVDDLARVRRTPSLQLAGMPGMLDLNALGALGVEVVGRLVGIRDGRAQFSGALANHCAMADLKMNRLLALIDDWAMRQGLDGAIEPERFEPTRVPASPRLELDLAGGEIASIVWATGFRPDFSWLDAPVFDRKGRLVHDGGIVLPGLTVMGLPFMRRRKSTLIDGAGADARDLADHVLAGLGRRAA